MKRHREEVELVHGIQPSLLVLNLQIPIYLSILRKGKGPINGPSPVEMGELQKRKSYLSQPRISVKP